MMATLFFRQSEHLNSINLDGALLWYGFYLTAVVGSVFFLGALVLFWLKVKRPALGLKKKLGWWLTLCWLPLAANFFYNRWFDWRTDVKNLPVDAAAKTAVRWCALDQASGLNGLLCGVIDFTKVVNKELPPGASVRLVAPSGLRPYFYYQLVGRYSIITTAEKPADYLFVYQPAATAAGVTVTEQLTRIDVSGYYLLKEVAAGQFIFKRQAP